MSFDDPTNVITCGHTQPCQCPPPERSTPTIGPDRWLGRDGLLVKQLCADIALDLPIMHDAGHHLWVYQSGVWTADIGQVDQAVAHRLGDRFRPAHANTVARYFQATSPRIEVDPVPDVLNVQNGLLHWRTGELHIHSFSIPSTVQLAVAWNPDADCPTIIGWFREVLPADLLEPTADGPGFIWELLGYLVFSGNPLHKAILLLGSGRNGKGTFLRLLVAILGRRNVSAVALHELVENRFKAAELLGKLANVAGDLDGDRLDSTALFKQITGGDLITADRKYGQPFDFTAWATPVYSANKVFGSPDTSAGYLSRWVVIPFPHSFEDREDRSIENRLHTPSELEGVLVRAVEGLRALMRRGNFTIPPSAAEAFRQFANESDLVRAFVDEVTVTDESATIERKNLFGVYQVWCREAGLQRPLGRNTLFRRLEAAGLRLKSSDGVRHFTGRRLIAHISVDAYGAEELSYPPEFAP